MTLYELKEQIENVDIKYPLDECYALMQNTMIDYWNDTQDFFAEEYFEDYVDDEIVKEYITEIVRNDDLNRLYYFLNGSDFTAELFRIDAYGNLKNIDTCDMEALKQDLLDEINDKIKYEQEGRE